MDPAQRDAFAARVQVAQDFELPRLRHWNYELCRKHRAGWVETFTAEDGLDHQRTVVDRPKPGCRQCGIHFRKHQRVGISWLYFKGRALLADTVGSGKTAHAAGLIAMCREAGETEDGQKWVIVCRAPALLQWQDELHRMLKGLQVQVATGTRNERISKYLSPFDVLVIGPEMLRNDYELLLRSFPVHGLIVDDVDALRHRENRTAYVIKRIAREVERMVIMTGTPLQKRLHELHSVLEPIGGREIFGPESAFIRRYVRQEKITDYNRTTGKKTTRMKVVGYKNTGEFKDLLRPLALRRIAADIDDVDMPEIVSDDVILELYPSQRAKYDELKRGVITIMREEGVQVKRATAMAKLHYGAQICGGLASLGEADGEGASVKLDWIMDKLDGGDLSDEKVVIFCAYKNTIRALHKRFADAGVGYVTVWGDEPDRAARKRAQEAFWEDPSVRVLIGTQAIEQSLNLQVARHLVNVDMILNPARMEQLAGRIRRDGSAFKHVYVHNLLTTDTQESRYMPLLEREQALISHIWDENSALFEQLNPMALMQLITG
jgi:SNF2 family DNA or RNA helicase